MRIIECTQGSSEWFAARLGKVSASRIADIVAKTKTGYSTSRANYAAQLIAERLTGVTADSYSNAAMEWGKEQEPNARKLYELMTDCSVVEVGCVLHPMIDEACASPDGLVGDDGLVEIKCPNTATHIETLLSETIDGKYQKQMQWQMLCTERAWCDYVSFDPRLPADMQLFVKRLHRDDAYIDELEREVMTFIDEVAARDAALIAKYRTQLAA